MGANEESEMNLNSRLLLRAMQSCESTIKAFCVIERAKSFYFSEKHLNQTSQLFVGRLVDAMLLGDKAGRIIL